MLKYIILLLLLLPPLGSAQLTLSAEQSARMDWSARIAEFDPGSQNEAWAKPDFNHSHWKTLQLPAYFDQEALPDFDGVVWFRKTIDLPRAGTGTLHLGPIDDMDVTWVNGVRVGGYEQPGHHFTNRSYPITWGILKKGRNTIAVRVMDHGWPGGMAGKPAQMQLEMGATKIPLAGPWKYKAGADLASLVHGVPKANPNLKPFANGAFNLLDEEIIAIVGGGSMVKLMENGRLELMLTKWGGDKKITFRDSAWQADTVYRRQRPRNFGSASSTLNRVKATTIIAGFGQMEAMDGTARLKDFIAAYEALLDEYTTITPRIILVTPFTFAGRPHAEYKLKQYAAAIVALAERRNLPCIDMSGFASEKLYLNERQHQQYALMFMKQLTGTTPEGWQSEALLEAIHKKNRLWRQHWRPTNWSFAYGNRTHVPSSHDHRKGQPRWMPAEIQGILSLVEATEKDIAALRKREAGR